MAALEDGLIKGKDLGLHGHRVSEDLASGGQNSLEARGGAVTALRRHMEEAGQFLAHQRDMGPDRRAIGSPGIHITEAAATSPNRGPVTSLQCQLKGSSEKSTILHPLGCHQSGKTLTKLDNKRLGDSIPPTSSLRPPRRAASHHRLPSRQESRLESRIIEHSTIELPVQ
jgi:hypothetical protein